MSRMGDLAATDVYNAFDVPGEQSTNVGWANRLGEILTARPPDNPAVAYRTPYFDITEGDIGRATEAAMGVSGGGMKVEAPKGIKAFHSSPHDFDKFDLSKIGTGEGAQVYGHGLYFAESPAVSGQGGQYWEQFANKFRDRPAEYEAAQMLKREGFNQDSAIAKNLSDIEFYQKHPGQFKPQLEQALAQHEFLTSGKPVGPRTYEVNINADPAHMLDWDKVIAANDPLRQMVAGSARTAFDRATTGANRNIAKDALLAAEGESLTGQGVYEQLARTNTRPGAFPEINIKQPARASEMLREAGIPGIKYLDQGSRNATPVLKTDKHGNVLSSHYPPPTSNYVVFDPGIIDIMKKYGIAGAAPVGMGALAAQDRYE